MSYQVADQWEWTLKVDSYMVGPEWTLRPAYQLKLQQEVGERHFAAGGLGYETLYREGVVFVLTRLNSVIRRAPRLHETVRLQTWHRSPKGSQFFRCYRFLSEAGDPLIESVSAFTLVDPVQHRLLRPAAFEKFGVAGQDYTVDCPDPAKMRMPAGLQPVGDHVVRRSEIDFNGHLNNTEYAELLADYAPGGMEGRTVWIRHRLSQGIPRGAGAGAVRAGRRQHRVDAGRPRRRDLFHREYVLYPITTPDKGGVLCL